MNLHSNVSGTPTDTPRLIAEDPAHSARYEGNLSVPNRCTFRVPDTINGGFTVHWSNKSARSVFPPYPRLKENYEAGDPRDLQPPLPTLEYTSALLRLRANDVRFETEDGQPIFLLTTTDFLLFNRMLRGEDITPIVQQRKSVGRRGFNEHRVTLLMQFLPALLGWPILRPENYGDYWNVLRQFVEFMGRHQQRVKLTAWCDMQMINRDPAWQWAFLLQTADTLRDLTNWRLEPGNEWEVNGWDPRDVRQIAGVLMSRGSSSIDKPPITPGLSAGHEYHRRRDWPKYANGDDLGFISAGSIQNGHDVRRPVDDAEPVGFDEVFSPARRLTTPSAARAVRRTAEEFAAATCFHTTPGLHSHLWGPTVTACGDAFAE